MYFPVRFKLAHFVSVATENILSNGCNSMFLCMSLSLLLKTAHCTQYSIYLAVILSDSDFSFPPPKTY